MISEPVQLKPYNTNLVVICTTNPSKEIARFNYRNKWAEIENPGDHYTALTMEKLYKGQQWIWVVLDPTDKELAATVVHESVHVVNAIFKHVGVELDVDKDEQQAYFTEYVYDTILKQIKKNGKQ